MAAGAAAGGTALGDSTTAPCGAATATTVQSVVGSVATNIYRGELIGGEVFANANRVASSARLLAAVASGRRSAVYGAVHALVYHPIWHIVRLRVLDAAGHVLADIGGPFIIAPVAGVLRSGGRTIGSFLMSVQDDVGFTKLETHAAGDPIGIYYQGGLVASLGAHFPALAPSAATMTVGSVAYSVIDETYNAFPKGTLTAVILVPPPPAAWASQTVHRRDGGGDRARRTSSSRTAFTRSMRATRSSPRSCTTTRAPWSSCESGRGRSPGARASGRR